MLARNEVILKWLIYATATALCFLLQGFLLQRFTLWGVIPFIYPLLAAIPSTYESSTASTVFSLCVGVFCDLLLPGSLPCLYTLIFPLVGLCSSLLSQNLLPAGMFCSISVTAIAFLLTDLFHCLLLWMSGHNAWSAGCYLMLREFCVTLPFTIPVTFLYRAVYRKTHLYD